jgi:hypothetical protein
VGLFGRRRKRHEEHGEHTLVVATLNARVMPVDRGERYEDPLDAQLGKRGLGHVSGGGTMQQENGEIDFVDIELELHDTGAGTLDLVVQVLETMGAPLGSKLAYDGGERPFGKNEGLAVYVNGTDLPDEVYATCDINVVIERFDELLGEAGAMQGHWQGDTETALYYYGPSFTEMSALIAPYLAEYPLLDRARLVRIA